MRILIPILALAVASCGTGRYAADFAAESGKLADEPTNAEGPWIGEWESEVNGHKGPLWCIVRPGEEEGSYEFRYRAGWGMLKFGDYAHSVEAEMAADGSLPLRGDMELPAGLGVYSVDGRLTKDRFEATYESAGDRGAMRLKRPR